MYLLSNYATPHKLVVSLSYDYNPTAVQTSTIEPTNFSAPYGGDTLYGSNELYGGSSNVEQWRIFLRQQKCQSIQVSIEEVFDPSKGTVAGAGLSFSGINMVIGAKKAYPALPSAKSVG